MSVAPATLLQPAHALRREDLRSGTINVRTRSEGGNLAGVAKR